MRIVAGKYRSRKIEFPNVPSRVRPTMDKVREAVFSSLNMEVVNASVLDLFAGSGAYGLEALSRGASHAVFVDNFKLSIEAIKNNIETLKENNAEVIANDYKVALFNLKDKNIKFDIVFLDPPYKKDIYKEVVDYLLENEMMNEHPIFVLECDHELDFSYLDNYKIKRYNYSDTIVYVLRG